MENICRICMTVSDDLISMVKEINPNVFEVLTVGEMFEECFGLKLEEVPTIKKICMPCKIQLTYFLDFKVQALKTHEKLLKMQLEDDYGDDETPTKDEDETDDVIIVEYLDDEQESEIPHIDSQAQVHVIEEVAETEELVQSTEAEGVSDLEDNPPQGEESEFDETKFLEYLESENWKKKPRKRSKKVHSKAYFKYNCELCGKNFRYQSTFTAHQNVHNGLPAYNCSICNRGFKEKLSFEYHKRWHAGIRPFVCKICGKGFGVKSHMKYHLETHSESNQNECPICHQMYKTRTTLKMHMESIHIRSKQYFCPICDKSFFRRYYMMVHYRTHKKKGEVSSSLGNPE